MVNNINFWLISAVPPIQYSFLSELTNATLKKRSNRGSVLLHSISSLNVQSCSRRVWNFHKKPILYDDFCWKAFEHSWTITSRIIWCYSKCKKFQLYPKCHLEWMIMTSNMPYSLLTKIREHFKKKKTIKDEKLVSRDPWFRTSQ